MQYPYLRCERQSECRVSEQLWMHAVPRAREAGGARAVMNVHEMRAYFMDLGVFHGFKRM